ncbi:hypothetical protein LguiB_005420 [Lonicera macranthoides]
MKAIRGSYVQRVRMRDEEFTSTHYHFLRRRKIINFRDVVDECAFVDLGCQGYRFTWENNHHNEETYGDARQDWVFVTKDWSDLFSFARVLNVIQHGSDHMPIKLCLQGIVGNQRVRQYRSRKFEEWCEVVVSNAWVGVASNDQCSGNFSQRLRDTAVAIVGITNCVQPQRNLMLTVAYDETEIPLPIAFKTITLYVNVDHESLMVCDLLTPAGYFGINMRDMEL